MHHYEARDASEVGPECNEHHAFKDKDITQEELKYHQRVRIEEPPEPNPKHEQPNKPRERCSKKERNIRVQPQQSMKIKAKV